jgi:hypothetical protein
MDRSRANGGLIIVKERPRSWSEQDIHDLQGLRTILGDAGVFEADLKRQLDNSTPLFQYSERQSVARLWRKGLDDCPICSAKRPGGACFYLRFGAAATVRREDRRAVVDLALGDRE